MAVDAVLRPLEADVVTTRTKYGMEMGLCKCAIAIWLGSSLLKGDTQKSPLPVVSHYVEAY